MSHEVGRLPGSSLNGTPPRGAVLGLGKAGKETQQRDEPLENQRPKGYCSPPSPVCTCPNLIVKAVVGKGWADLTNKNTNGHLNLNFR